MKLSISLPDPMAKEIKALATHQRNVSWWIQRAWTLARTQLLRDEKGTAAAKRAIKKICSLRGALKANFPDVDSVTLSKTSLLPLLCNNREGRPGNRSIEP